ncbi:4158_t:CDS:1, partial [Paraglomus occultum]
MGRLLIAEQWLFELTASILCISSVAEVTESGEVYESEVVSEPE